MANSRAKSLVTLVQRVLEGLERQRAAMIAAAAARSSELDRAKQQLLDVPLVLSSTSFLPGGENAPDGQKNVEEGELAGDDDEDINGSSSDMDVEGDSEEEVKPAGRNPYGVIEVSSVLAEKERSSESELAEGLGFPSLESDSSALHLPPRPKRRKLPIAVKEEDEDDEEVVINLT